MSIDNYCRGPLFLSFNPFILSVIRAFSMNEMFYNSPIVFVQQGYTYVLCELCQVCNSQNMLVQQVADICQWNYAKSQVNAITSLRSLKVNLSPCWWYANNDLSLHHLTGSHFHAKQSISVTSRGGTRQCGQHQVEGPVGADSISWQR